MLDSFVLEDLPQGANPQRLVSRNGEVLLLGARTSGQPHVTARLASQRIAMAAKALGQKLAIDIPRDLHRASSSCFT